MTPIQISISIQKKNTHQRNEQPLATGADIASTWNRSPSNTLILPVTSSTGVEGIQQHIFLTLQNTFVRVQETNEITDFSHR
jgi:hypothetical protein